MPKVLFRMDATPAIGAGHLMRSVALAQYLQSRGSEIFFITRKPWDLLAHYLQEQNFHIKFLSLPEEELGNQEDLGFLLAELKQDFDWVVLDNYYFDHNYQKAVKKTGVRLLAIHDMAGREFCCDILLNHGLQAPKLNYDARAGCRLLLGTDYALIRRELIQAKKKSDRKASNILVTLGGGEDGGIFEKVIEAIRLIRLPEVQVKVLGGFSDESPERLEKYADNAEHFQICRASLDLSDLYQWADLAICAGGGTCWELCFFGVVGLVGILSDNQEGVANSLDEAGVFKSVGWYAKRSAQEIAQALKDLIQNQEKLQNMRQKALRLVDGRGPERIFNAMQEVECEIGQNQR